MAPLSETVSRGHASLYGMAANRPQHRVQSIPASRAQVLSQTDLVYEAVTRIQDCRRWESRVRAKEDRDQARHDRSIARGLKGQHTSVVESPKPDLGLTSLDLVLVRLAFLREFRQLTTEVNEMLVTVHPVVEELELIDDFSVDVLNGLARHCRNPCLGF